MFKPRTVSSWLLSAISLSTKEPSHQKALCKGVGGGGGRGGEGVLLSGYKERAKGICIHFNVIVQKVSGLREMFLYASYFPGSFFSLQKQTEL